MNAAAAWKDCRLIWAAIVVWRDPRAATWAGRLLLFVALALFAARAAGVLAPEVFVKLELMLAIGAFAMLWLIGFVPFSVLMNSAANARLVPRQRRRLMQIAAGGWLFVTLGFTAASGRWELFPLVGFYLLGGTLLRAGFRPALALIVVAANWPLISRRLLPAPVLEAMTGTPGLLAESALVLLLAAWSLWLLYPAGGDRHLDGRAGRVSSIQRFQPREQAARQGLRWVDRVAYGPALRRACRRRKPEAMLMHALGPNAHWSAWLVGSAIVLGIGLALRLLPLLFGRPASQGMSDYTLGFGISATFFMVVFSTAHLVQQLRRTGGEQALLRLTPLAGDTALLNRRLAAGLVKAALGSWAMLTAVILLTAWLIGANGEIVLRYLAMCCLGGQLALSGVLGDFGRRLPSFGLTHFARLVLQAGCNIALAFGLGWLGGVTAIWLALVSVIGAVVLLARGWRRMLAAAPAYPVRRME